MLGDPVGERLLKTDVVTSLLGLDPFVFENLRPLHQELTIDRGVPKQEIRGGRLAAIFHTAISVCEDCNARA